MHLVNPMYVRIPLKYRLAVVLGLLAVIYLTSCTTQRKVEKWNDKHPLQAATYCAETFPAKDSLIVRDSVHFDTLYQPSEVLTDTVYVEGKPLIIKRECPPQKVITQTIRRDSFIIRVDGARLAALELSYQEYKKTSDDLQNVSNRIIERQKEIMKAQRKAIWYLILAVIALLVWNFRKPLLKLIGII